MVYSIAISPYYVFSLLLVITKGTKKKTASCDMEIASQYCNFNIFSINCVALLCGCSNNLYSQSLCLLSWQHPSLGKKHARPSPTQANSPSHCQQGLSSRSQFIWERACKTETENEHVFVWACASLLCLCIYIQVCVCLLRYLEKLK